VNRPAAVLLALALAGCTMLGTPTRPAPDTKTTASTPSGVRYAILTPGRSAIVAQVGDRVSVHYTGWLTSGKQFDSSLGSGEPFEFTIGRGEVIAGWDEGVAGMKVGEKRKLVIPPSLGYGAEGTTGIPGNSTLLFEVELLAIKAR
jgi:FKBP-type peptidyl-prolyl cis-trans isomerase